VSDKAVNARRRSVIRVLVRIGLIAFLGMCATLSLCWYGAFRLRASRSFAAATLAGHVHFSSSDTPDPRLYDPGRNSYRSFTPSTSTTQAPAPSGWFGYVTRGELPFAPAGWHATQVFIVKMDPADPEERSRVAARFRDNYFADFPRWSRASKPATPADDLYPYVAEYAFGWPEAALMFEVRFDHIRSSTQVLDAVPLPLLDTVTGRSSLQADQATLYPLRPIVGGLLVNVLVLGVLADRAFVWFVLPMLRMGARLARRGRGTLRTRRGLCSSCRYPIGPSVAKCPECGEPARR
jgi:hypothetical protein